MHPVKPTFVLLTAFLVALGCGSATEVETAPESVQILTDSLGTALSPIAREMVLANVEAERDLNLILRFQTRPGALFEVYEPEPGVLVYSGGGSREVSVAKPVTTEAEVHAAAIEAALASATPAGGTSVARDRVDALTNGTLVEVLARIVPRSLELPEVEAAVRRQRERFEARGSALPGPSLEVVRPLVKEILGPVAEVSAVEQNALTEGVGNRRDTLDTAYSGGFCDEEYFTEQWPDYPPSWPSWCFLYDNPYWEKWKCPDDARLTRSESDGDTYYGITNVCSAYGTVTLSVKWVDHETNWTVNKDYWRFFWARDSGCDGAGWSSFDDCPYFRSAVKDATSDERYHWRLGITRD